MKDRYLDFVNSPFGMSIARSLGLPRPEVLRRCAAYIEHFAKNPTFILHHTFKTPEERKEAARVKRNAKARERRAAAKAAK